MVLSDEQTRGLLTDFQKKVKEYALKIIESKKSKEYEDKYVCGIKTEYFSAYGSACAINHYIHLPFETRLNTYNELNYSINCFTERDNLNSNNEDISDIIKKLCDVRNTLFSNTEEYQQMRNLDNRCRNYVHKAVTSLCNLFDNPYKKEDECLVIIDVLDIPLTIQNIDQLVKQIPHFKKYTPPEPWSYHGVIGAGY